jgi:hypothetical protein
LRYDYCIGHTRYLTDSNYFHKSLLLKDYFFKDADFLLEGGSGTYKLNIRVEAIIVSVAGR